MRRESQNPLISSKILCPFAEQSSLACFLYKKGLCLKKVIAVLLPRNGNHIKEKDH
jgi:hypothetical protein